MRAAQVLILAALAALIAGAAGASLGRPAGSAGGAAAQGGQTGELRVAGSVEGLYPGAAVRFPVRVQNRHWRSVTIRSVRARAGSAAPGCPGALLRIAPSIDRMRIPPRSARRTRLTAVLSPDATDACQGQAFPLTFRARGVQSP